MSREAPQSVVAISEGKDELGWMEWANEKCSSERSSAGIPARARLSHTGIRLASISADRSSSSI